MAVAGAGEADAAEVQIAATAVSQQRSLLVQVSADGYVVGVRLLSEAPRQWDSQTLNKRAVAVAAVAHDRYLANRPSVEGRYPSPDAVAADERRLQF